MEHPSAKFQTGYSHHFPSTEIVWRVAPGRSDAIKREIIGLRDDICLFVTAFDHLGRDGWDAIESTGPDPYPPRPDQSDAATATLDYQLNRIFELNTPTSSGTSRRAGARPRGRQHRNRVGLSLEQELATARAKTCQGPAHYRAALDLVEVVLVVARARTSSTDQ